MLEHEGGMTFAPYMSDKACDAWGKYVFLSRVFSQLMDGAPVLTCPRSDQTLGQIGNAEFCMEGECAEHIGQGHCAGWYPEGWQPLPNCLFIKGIKKQTTHIFGSFTNITKHKKPVLDSSSQLQFAEDIVG